MKKVIDLKTVPKSAKNFKNRMRALAKVVRHYSREKEKFAYKSIQVGTTGGSET